MNLQRQLFDLEAKMDLLDITDPQYHVLNDEANALAQEIEDMALAAEARQVASRARARLNEVKANIMAKADNNSSFGSFDDWFKWAKSLYPVEETNGQHIVHSNAKEWTDDNPMYWVCNSEVEALEKIDQLIDYKIKDRNRGSGDMSKDIK